MSLRSHIAVFCWLTAGVACWGQGMHEHGDAHRFFASQAQSDGLFEQQVTFTSEKDEWDFWKDQRAYERQLYKKDVSFYVAYILSKRNVYAAHQPICGDRCQHGDYFYIQSAFYLQFAEEDAALLSAISQNKTARGASGMFGH